MVIVPPVKKSPPKPQNSNNGHTRQSLEHHQQYAYQALSSPAPHRPVHLDVGRQLHYPRSESRRTRSCPLRESPTRGGSGLCRTPRHQIPTASIRPRINTQRIPTRGRSEQVCSGVPTVRVDTYEASALVRKGLRGAIVEEAFRLSCSKGISFIETKRWLSSTFIVKGPEEVLDSIAARVRKFA